MAKGGEIMNDPMCKKMYNTFFLYRSMLRKLQKNMEVLIYGLGNAAGIHAGRRNYPRGWS